MTLDAFAYQVERSAHPMFFQHIEQARRIAWVRTIVKGQRDPAAQSITLVEDSRMLSLCCPIGML